MTINDFVAYLREGNPATIGVRKITGIDPTIVTVADYFSHRKFVRYGIMMCGTVMAAIVILELDAYKVSSNLLDRIRNGEPAGAVLDGLARRCYASYHNGSIQSGATLYWQEHIIGKAQEVFTREFIGLMDIS